jgi:translation initiation factor IF-3
VPLSEALAAARDRDLDLVEVAPDANPPVCRIMDHGKEQFEAAARAKEARRRSHQAQLKEMRFSVRIGPGDFDTKTRKIADFLRDGHKVRVTVRFRRNREMSRTDVGRVLLDRVVASIDHAKVEAPARLDGTQMTMLLAPQHTAGTARADRDKMAP